jgi:SNF2 family DNA or RNA helicase
MMIEEQVNKLCSELGIRSLNKTNHKETLQLIARALEERMRLVKQLQQQCIEAEEEMTFIPHHQSTTTTTEHQAFFYEEEETSTIYDDIIIDDEITGTTTMAITANDEDNNTIMNDCTDAVVVESISYSTKSDFSYVNASTEADTASDNHLKQLEKKYQLQLPHYIYNRLMPHQKEGVDFVWNCLHTNHPINGCVLADFMGLGKTLQIVSIINLYLTVNKVLSTDSLIINLLTV